MCDEERKDLARRQGVLHAEGVKVQERIEAIKTRKEKITQVQKIKVTLERRLGMFDNSFPVFIMVIECTDGSGATLQNVCRVS
jgi:hypothetical protein